MKKYQMDIVVEAEDLDDLNHVNNVRYLEWVQDISREHWNRLSQPEWDRKYIWVVKTHSITYHRPATEGESLRLTTYVPEAKGAISKRVVEIHLKGRETRIADCQTEWCLLDAQSGRPVRIPEEMRLCFE